MKKKILREVVDAKIFRLKSMFYFFQARYGIISVKEANVKTLISAINMMKTMQELDVVEKQIDILKSRGVI